MPLWVAMSASVAARVYAQDCAAAELCTRMSQRGFSFDTARAKEIAESLRASEQEAIAKCDAALGRPLKRTKTDGISTKDLEVAFFGDMKAPVFFRSQLTNKPSLGIDSMRGYAACQSEALRALALGVLEFRRARKIRSTYVEAVVIDDDGRVHPGWQNYGAVSGRWSCADPNLMNLPRRSTDPTSKTHNGGIRSLYRASRGCSLVAFDKKQLEMRIAAYASGDAAMIAACESVDLHSSNATILFGDAFMNCTDPVARAQMRTAAKSAGFAVCYLAEAPTVYARIVAEGLPIKLRQVEVMLARLQRGFGTYYSWQGRRLLECIRRGYTDTPILRRQRWLGHEPTPTECANFPIQGGAADVMNALLAPGDGSRGLEATIRAEAPGAAMVAQVHDSAVFDVPNRYVARVEALCSEFNARPVAIDSSGAMLNPILGIDLETSECWH